MQFRDHGGRTQNGFHTVLDQGRSLCLHQRIIDDERYYSSGFVFQDASGQLNPHVAGGVLVVETGTRNSHNQIDRRPIPRRRRSRRGTTGIGKQDELQLIPLCFTSRRIRVIGRSVHKYRVQHDLSRIANRGRPRIGTGNGQDHIDLHLHRVKVNAMSRIRGKKDSFRIRMTVRGTTQRSLLLLYCGGGCRDRTVAGIVVVVGTSRRMIGGVTLPPFSTNIGGPLLRDLVVVILVTLVVAIGPRNRQRGGGRRRTQVSPSVSSGCCCCRRSRLVSVVVVMSRLLRIAEGSIGTSNVSLWLLLWLLFVWLRLSLLRVY